MGVAIEQKPRRGAGQRRRPAPTACGRTPPQTPHARAATSAAPLHREVRDIQRSDDAPFTKSLPSAIRSLQDCTYRVTTAEQLLKLKGFGAKTAGVRIARPRRRGAGAARCMTGAARAAWV